MSAYISKFENTWAVIHTDEKGNVHVTEFYSKDKAEAFLDALRTNKSKRA